jgi:hypothetical protein
VQFTIVLTQKIHHGKLTDELITDLYGVVQCCDRRHTELHKGVKLQWTFYTYKALLHKGGAGGGGYITTSLPVHNIPTFYSLHPKFL